MNRQGLLTILAPVIVVMIAVTLVSAALLVRYDIYTTEGAYRDSGSQVTSH